VCSSDLEAFMDRMIFLISGFMKDKTEFTGTPTQLSALLSANSDDQTAISITAKSLSKRLMQNAADLERVGITFISRRSNGKRLITLRRMSDDSDDETGSVPAPPSVDPDGTASHKIV
ncbi:MAG: hypothetical protein LBR47_02245, partial [Spirochaetaceae bacterium]|jgi:hypothetical protein|nr:hypothetical protein [Spirochaetaceae bacterium]